MADYQEAQTVPKLGKRFTYSASKFAGEKLSSITARHDVLGNV
jgi:hypothetical protein